MSDTVVATGRLDLVLESTDAVLARIEAMPAADRAEVSAEWLARLREAKVADPWTHGFAVVERASGATVGSCGYKGPPDGDGVVEIAYGIEKVWQGRGYATEVAAALVGFAHGWGGIRLVSAHTMPGNGASGRVLMKCGFQCTGEVVDPEDGLVLRWERVLE